MLPLVAPLSLLSLLPLVVPLLLLPLVVPLVLVLLTETADRHLPLKLLILQMNPSSAARQLPSQHPSSSYLQLAHPSTDELGLLLPGSAPASAPC
jgi:hypothetical protein